MARTETVKVKEQDMDQKFLSVLLGKDISKQSLNEKERSKIDIFESGLASQLSTEDTIHLTVEKIVKMALACEFGPSLLTKSGAKAMVSTISSGILSDRELRKSVLVIADRFATGKKENVITIRGKGKSVING